MLLLAISSCTAICGTSRTFLLQQQPGKKEPPSSDSNKTKTIVYTNKKFGFSFSLPESWKGYSIVVGEWEGGDGRTYRAGEAMPPPVKGPLISIKHPLSTKENPRQDIPIMVFTKAQWDSVEEEKLIVSAAPIGPSELGRNEKYVFELPARYNYALITGWEEAEDIMQHHPLQAITPE